MAGTMTVNISTNTYTKEVYIVRVDGHDVEFSTADFAFAYATTVDPKSSILILKRITITEILH